jgi:hypothetical protein
VFVPINYFKLGSDVIQFFTAVIYVRHKLVIYSSLAYLAIQVLYLRVGSWPYIQRLEWAGKSCRGQEV